MKQTPWVKHAKTVNFRLDSERFQENQKLKRLVFWTSKQLSDPIHGFQVDLQLVELMHRAEHVDQLHHSAAEKVKTTKNEALVEVKLLAFGQSHELVLGEVILLLIGLIELQTNLQVLDELRG